MLLLKIIIFFILRVWKFSSHWRGGESAFIFITELLNYLQNTYVGNHFAGAVFSEQEYIYIYTYICIFRLWLESLLYTFPIPLQLLRAWKPKFILKVYNFKITNTRTCAGMRTVFYFCGVFLVTAFSPLSKEHFAKHEKPLTLSICR